MSQENKIENQALVHLRKLNPEHYSFSVLGFIFKISKVRAHEIYHENKDKYPLPDWVELSPDHPSNR